MPWIETQPYFLLSIRGFFDLAHDRIDAVSRLGGDYVISYHFLKFSFYKRSIWAGTVRGVNQRLDMELPRT